MFRYQPPKSNTWGHRLGRLSGEQVRSRFQEFMSLAVSESTYADGSVAVQIAAEVTVKLFEQLLDRKSVNNYFYGLTESQCDSCIAQLIQDGRYSNADGPVIVTKSIHIAKWRMQDIEVNTDSRILLHYGPQPVISTHLHFHTVDEFRFVKSALESVQLCKLNEKHLREMKVPSRVGTESR